MKSVWRAPSMGLVLLSLPVGLTGCVSAGTLECSTSAAMADAGAEFAWTPLCSWMDTDENKPDQEWQSLSPRIVFDDQPSWLSFSSSVLGEEGKDPKYVLVFAVDATAPTGEFRIPYHVEYNDPTCAPSEGCGPLKSVPDETAVASEAFPRGSAQFQLTVANTSAHNVELTPTPVPYSVTVDSVEVSHCADHSRSCTFSAPSTSSLAFTVPSAPATCTWTCGTQELPCSAARFTVTEDVTCTMQVPTQQLTYGTTGDGSGQVDVYMDGTQFIGCDGQCDLPKDKQLELRAMQAAGSDFRGWTGDCAGLGANATIVLDADKSCTAEFAQNTAMDTLVVELLNTDGMNIELFAEDNTPLTQQGSEYTTSVPHMTEVPLAVRTVGDVTIDFSVAWACGTTLSTTGHNVSIPVNGPTHCTATIEREDPCAGTPTAIVPAVLVSQNGASIGSNTSSPDTPSYPVATDFGVELTSVSSGGHGPLQVRWVLPAGPVFGTTYVWPNNSLDSGTHQVILELTDACAQTESLIFNIAAR